HFAVSCPSPAAVREDLAEGAGERLRGGRRSAGEDLAQGGGEGVRIARPAVFAAGESVAAAREGDGRGREPSSHGDGRAASDDRAGFGCDGDDDAGGCRAERVEIVLVVVARHDVLPDERVVAGAVVLGRQPESAGLGAGWSAKPGGIGPWWLTSAMNFAIAGPKPQR